MEDITTAAARNADTEFIVRRSSRKGQQWMSLLTPPAYVAFVLSQRGRAQLSVSRVLRATWTGSAVGVAGGAAAGYASCYWSSDIEVRKRRMRAAYDTSSIRADDHAAIGGLLFAILTPAMLWKRANKLDLILGGFGIGSALGLLAHHGKSLTGDRPPEARVPEIPVPSA